MAKYRPVHINIWKDPDFESYSSTMKLIFLYLCTNETTTESGIYPITTKTISNETGIPSKTVGKLLGNGLKNIIYDFKNNIVFVKNFLNYNGGGRPDLLQKSIERDYKFYKTELWNEFIKTYPEWSSKLKPIISNPNTNSISNTNTNTNTKDGLANGLETVDEKVKYADTVNMFEKQYKKLIEKYGEENTKKMITILDNYKDSKGKTYKNDYKAILSWVVDKVIKKNKEDWRTT